MSANRDDEISDHPIDVRAIHALHRAGWSVGDYATAGPDGRTWHVWGSNGENLIRAEGPTRDAAWLRAVEEARRLLMLGLTP